MCESLPVFQIWKEALRLVFFVEIRGERIIRFICCCITWWGVAEAATVNDEALKHYGEVVARDVPMDDMDSDPGYFERHPGFQM